MGAICASRRQLLEDHENVNTPTGDIAAVDVEPVNFEAVQSLISVYSELSPLVLKAYVDSVKDPGKFAENPFGFGAKSLDLSSNTMLQRKALRTLETLLLQDPTVQELKMTLVSDNLNWIIEAIPKILEKKKHFKFQAEFKSESIDVRLKSVQEKVKNAMKSANSFFINSEESLAFNALTKGKFSMKNRGISISLSSDTSDEKMQDLAKLINESDLKEMTSFTVGLSSGSAPWQFADTLIRSLQLPQLKELVIQPENKFALGPLISIGSSLSKFPSFETLVLSHTGEDFSVDDSESEEGDVLFEANPITIRFDFEESNADFNRFVKFLNRISFHTLRCTYNVAKAGVTFNLSELKTRDAHSLSIRELVSSFHEIESMPQSDVLRKLDLAVQVPKSEIILDSKESCLQSFKGQVTSSDIALLSKNLTTSLNKLSVIDLNFIGKVSGADLEALSTTISAAAQVKSLTIRAKSSNVEFSESVLNNLLIKSTNLEFLGILIPIAVSWPKLFDILSKNSSLLVFSCSKHKESLKKPDVKALCQLLKANKTLHVLNFHADLESEDYWKEVEATLLNNETLTELNRNDVTSTVMGILLRNRIAQTEKRNISLLHWIQKNFGSSELLQKGVISRIQSMYDSSVLLNVEHLE